MYRISTFPVPALVGTRAFVALNIALALVVAGLALVTPGTAGAQEQPDCDVVDLGTLASEAGSELRIEGRWTTEDCDSLFRIGSDAHTYRFRVEVPGRIRIELTSDDGDSHLTLLDEDGMSIDGDDDGGPGVGSRIERDLAVGAYLVEAATIGGRVRGPADFELVILRVGGCDPVDLGTLEPGAGLTAAGVWTPTDCGGRLFENHPAHTYRFVLPSDGEVRIDLTSGDSGSFTGDSDPFLTLLSPRTGLIDLDDDGGAGRNSQLELHLSAGTYLIEATTYRDRDDLPLSTDFNLVIRFRDPETFNIKVEDVRIPERVIANQPFTIHYRIGNVGRGDLTLGGQVRLFVFANGVRQWIGPIRASTERWQASVSYHSGAPTANATSVAIEEAIPFEISLAEYGPSWVYVIVDIHDESGAHVAQHGVWRNLTVLSGPTFDPVKVTVEDDPYVVYAEEQNEGLVRILVSSVTDPDADLDPSLREKAIYAAGVQTQMLEGIFERPLVPVLSDRGTEPSNVSITSPVNPANPSSDTLTRAFADAHSSRFTASGLLQRFASGELISPESAESLTLAAAEDARAQFRAIEASWTALQGRVAGGGLLSFADALAVHSQLAYAERLLSTAVRGGDIVAAARASESGWEDAEVVSMVTDLAEQASCGDGEVALRSALEATGAAGLATMLALDAELRAAMPAYGLANDAALCAAAGADEDTSLFLRGLTIAHSETIRSLLAPEPAEEHPPTRLRLLARLAEDGRIEHAVELAGGERILPDRRFLPSDSLPDRWSLSSDVQVGDVAIGRIRTRRLADGRVELNFQPADGEPIVPELRYLPSAAAVGTWHRSSEIEVPAPASMLE